MRRPEGARGRLLRTAHLRTALPRTALPRTALPRTVLLRTALLRQAFLLTALLLTVLRSGTAASAALPARWDWREHGRAPAVRDQGTEEICWALTAASALETALLPGQRTVFSAEHMVLENGSGTDTEEGGSYRMIMAYLAGGRGPVPEEETSSGQTDPDGPRQPSCRVQTIRLLEGASAEEIKEAVLRCGSVQTSLHMSRDTCADPAVYNPETASYYLAEERAVNHDVLILGWDDAYSAEHFGSDPGEDGAWICQNTWGSLFGEEGVFYVSYADANAARSGLAYEDIIPAGEAGTIRETDERGWQARIGYGKETCWFAGVFSADEDEWVQGAGFYAVGRDTEYEIYVVPWFQDTASFVMMEPAAKGRLADAGYYMIPFDRPAQAKEGRKYAVAVHIRTPGTDRPAAAEYAGRGGAESYVSLTGEIWEDAARKYGVNVCLKAAVVPCGKED